MNGNGGEQPNTYMDLYEEGKKRLSAAYIREYEIDARYLLLFVYGIDMNEMLMNYASPFTEREADLVPVYLDAVTKRADRIPLQHITHVQNFCGYDFSVNEKVLVPRQDTEILVMEAVKELRTRIKQKQNPGEKTEWGLLDLCTGSGCIAVTMKKEIPSLSVTASDISEEALAVAEENAKNNDASITFLQSDMYDGLGEKKFDVILCNPPYIRSGVIDLLDPEVKDHEPRIALDGDADGLKFYRILSSETMRHLNPGGRIFFEIGFDQAEDVTQLLKAAGFIDREVIKDFSGLDRVIRAGVNAAGT